MYLVQRPLRQRECVFLSQPPKVFFLDHQEGVSIRPIRGFYGDQLFWGSKGCLKKKTDYNIFNPFTPNGIIQSYILDKSICQLRGKWFSLFLSFSFPFKDKFQFFSLTNSVDPDQAPRFAAFELDLHCVPMSL